MRNTLLAVFGFVVLCVVLAALTVKKRDAVLPEFSTEHYTIQVATVVKGLSHPWASRFCSIAGTPYVHETSQEGLLDIALHPRFAENHLIYLT